MKKIVIVYAGDTSYVSRADAGPSALCALAMCVFILFNCFNCNAYAVECCER